MDTQNTNKTPDIVASELGDNCASYPENAKTNNLSRYSGEDYLPGVPTRNDIIAENDEWLTTILERVLANRENIPSRTIVPVEKLCKKLM